LLKSSKKGVWSIEETSPADVSFCVDHYLKTSLWAFNNPDDKAAPAEPMKNVIKQIRNTGGLAYLTERMGGHDSWARAMREDKVIAWLVNQDRERISPPPGIVLYSRNSILTPVFLFVLPILLSIFLVALQAFRRYRNGLTKACTEI